MNSIRRSFCVSSLISYGRSGGNIFNGGGGGSFLSIRVFLLLSCWWGSLVLILFIWLFQERLEREKGRKTGGQKAVAFGYILISSHFFPFLKNKKNSNNYFPSHLIFYYGYSMTHKSRLFVHFRSYPNLFSELVLTEKVTFGSRKSFKAHYI